MRDIMKLGIILMVYSLVAGAALAYVNIVTMQRVEDNRIAAAEEARSGALSGMEGGFELKQDGSGNEYWVGYKDKSKSQIGGYVFVARGKGYSSVIETMVGIDREGKIIGTQVVSQLETPGLGTKVMEIRHGENDPWFQRQFIGKSIQDDLRVNKDGGVIDSITGATISSRAMTNSIREGLEKMKGVTGGAGS
ncbi:MAG: RnfABCDGE type electron transport complex subunit G [Candidatus Latescibacterota bacterium]